MKGGGGAYVQYSTFQLPLSMYTFKDFFCFHGEVKTALSIVASCLSASKLGSLVSV